MLALSESAARRGLCQIPLDDALAAAGLTRDFSSWRASALELLDERATVSLGEQVLRRADEDIDFDERFSELAAIDWEIAGAYRVSLGSGAEALAKARGTTGSFTVPDTE